jgi:hypothetical protein
MRVAILGAGEVGTAIARVALRVGHEVRRAGSGAPEKIELPVDSARGALAVVADDSESAVMVAGFVDGVGFDPVVDLPLSRGRLLQPGTDILSSAMTRTDMAQALDHNRATQQNGITQ